MDRREFLRDAAGLGALSVLSGRVWALPEVQQIAGSRLLVVMLRGAYDGNSLLVPHGFPFYYASRSSIAIPAPQPDNPNTAIDIGQGYGLNPVLNGSLYPLFTQKQLAFVPFSGSQDLSRSHFEAQDTMELGQPAAHPDYRSGFLNRTVNVLQGKQPSLGGIAFTNNLPLSFKGSVQIPNIVLNNGIHEAGYDSQMQLVQAMYAHSKLDTYLQSGMQTRAEVSTTLAKEMQNASRGARGTSGFANTARMIAALMRDNANYNIGFIDLGGWDSHVNQGNSAGMLANNLNYLAQGLSQFADEMGLAAWRQSVVVVMSEFGRTFRENGTHGTDHGHGNTLWVLGGGISGGKLAGDMTDLTPDTLFQGRDTPVLNDYRSVLADLMRGMYGLNRNQLQQIFPDVNMKNYGLL